MFQTGFDSTEAVKKVDLRKQLRYNLYVRQPEYKMLDNGRRVSKDDYYEAILTIRDFQASDSGGLVHFW